MKTRYERVVGSVRVGTHFGGQRYFCTRCHALQKQEWTYDEARNIVCSAGCGQIVYELRGPTPKPTRVVTDRDLAIRRRIEAAERNLDRAVADVVAAVGRVKKWRARIGRLRAAFEQSAEARSARAKAGLATRTAKRHTRGIVVRKNRKELL